MFRHDGPELAAIVDWELTTIGDPLVDLGWVLATWPIHPGRRTEPSGRNRGPAFRGPTSSSRTTRGIRHVMFPASRHAVLGCYKLGIVNEGTYARACAGKASMETGQFLHRFAIGLLERAQRWIEES